MTRVLAIGYEAPPEHRPVPSLTCGGFAARWDAAPPWPYPGQPPRACSRCGQPDVDGLGTLLSAGFTIGPATAYRTPHLIAPDGTPVWTFARFEAHADDDKIYEAKKHAQRRAPPTT